VRHLSRIAISQLPHKENDMADFIFRVATVNLTAAQQKQIATAIQSTVLSEIAKLDLNPGPGMNPGQTAPALTNTAGSFLYRPHNWAGGIMIPPDLVSSVENSTLTVSETQV
jgi:hypothetical protein